MIRSTFPKQVFLVLAGAVLLQAVQPGTARASTLEERLDAVLGQADGLTADQTAQRTLQVDSALKGQEAATDVALSRAYRKLSEFSPKVTVKASYARLSEIHQPGFPVYEDARTLQGEVTVPLSDYALRIFQDYAAARKAYDHYRFEEEAVRLRRAAEARFTYYDWIRARATEIAADQNLEEAQERRRTVEERYRVGSAILADLLQVRAQVSAAELTRNQANHRVAYQLERLRIAMHDSPTAAYAIGEDFRKSPNIPAVFQAPEALQDLALAQRPEIKGMDALTQSLETKSRVALSKALPRLDLMATGTYADPNRDYYIPPKEFRSSWLAGAQVSWALHDIPTAASDIRKSRSAALQSRHETDVLRQTIRQEVTFAQHSLDEAKFGLETTRQELLAAEEAYRVRAEAFALRKATLTELTESETHLTEARLRAINASVDFRTEIVRLLHAIGDSRLLSAVSP